MKQKYSHLTKTEPSQISSPLLLVSLSGEYDPAKQTQGDGSVAREH
jgi:hypothetical protein